MKAEQIQASTVIPVLVLTTLRGFVSKRNGNAQNRRMPHDFSTNPTSALFVIVCRVYKCTVVMRDATGVDEVRIFACSSGRDARGFVSDDMQV